MKIYYVSGIDAFDERLVESCASFFPEWRKQQMLAYRHLSGRIKNAVSYLLLIHALREEGIFHEMPEFYYNEHSKPYLKNYPNWYFSISHCKTAVCCVLSTVEVGVDIEDIGEYKTRLAEYVCNEKELAFLNDSSDKADEFYKLWTMKEAVFKMKGTGINRQIKDILETPCEIKSYRIGDTWLSVSL